MAVSRDGAKRARTADLLGAMQPGEMARNIESGQKRLIYGEFGARIQAIRRNRPDLFLRRGHGMDIS